MCFFFFCHLPFFIFQSYSISTYSTSDNRRRIINFNTNLLSPLPPTISSPSSISTPSNWFVFSQTPSSYTIDALLEPFDPSYTSLSLFFPFLSCFIYIHFFFSKSCYFYPVKKLLSTCRFTALLLLIIHHL